MDKYTSVPDNFAAVHPEDRATVAETVHADFLRLVSILDQQLSTVADADEHARAHILKAKAAAECGLLLTTRLMDLLRAAEIRD